MAMGVELNTKRPKCLCCEDIRPSFHYVFMFITYVSITIM